MLRILLVWGEGSYEGAVEVFRLSGFWLEQCYDYGLGVGGLGLRRKAKVVADLKTQNTIATCGSEAFP